MSVTICNKCGKGILLKHTKETITIENGKESRAIEYTWECEYCNEGGENYEN